MTTATTAYHEPHEPHEPQQPPQDPHTMEDGGTRSTDTPVPQLPQSFQRPSSCVSVHCVHRGGAAVMSGNQAMTWLQAPAPFDDENNSSNNNNNSNSNNSRPFLLAYASHRVVHVCAPPAPFHGSSGKRMEDHPPYAAVTSLRTSCWEEEDVAVEANKTRITAIASSCCHPNNNNNNSTGDVGGGGAYCWLAVAYANGRVHLWERRQQNQQKQQQQQSQTDHWTEHVIVGGNTNSDASSSSHHHRSITCLDLTAAVSATHDELHIVTGSSAGVHVYRCTRTNPHNHPSNQTNHPSSTRMTQDSWKIQPWQPPCSPMTGPTTATAAVASVRWVSHHPQQQQQQPQPTSRLLLLLVGTAAPRHNKIHIFYPESSCNATASSANNNNNSDSAWKYAGGLTGHENWITSLAMDQDRNVDDDNNNNKTRQRMLLASGSQDARIRLWNFTTSTACTRNYETALAVDNATDGPNRSTTEIIQCDDNDDYDDDDDDDDNNNDPMAAGESRLEILHPGAGGETTTTTTCVSLEALLYGHEDGVTAVAWHPHPATTPYAVDHLLLSSSWDRSIWLWACCSSSNDNNNNHTEVWAPVSRVGGAGGILGGPLGSSLLGFCNVMVEPGVGRTIVGHAYGGALHVWQMQHDDHEQQQHDNSNDNNNNNTTPPTIPLTQLQNANDDDNNNNTRAKSMHVEERAAQVRWIASPCVTGHFDGVTDLSWETGTGAYLLTVSHDHTCRLWAPVLVEDGDPMATAHAATATITERGSVIWVELARPQVHGYSLSAVTSVSTPQHPHRIVTGADEKELRAFDAPLSTLRILNAVHRSGGEGIPILGDEHSSIQRVERAFIPSLGLSNKASATDAAEEDGDDDDEKSSDNLVDSTNAVSVMDTTTTAIPTTTTAWTLPSERDLGAISIWPEIRKLFGHNTEIYCLASTLAARTCPDFCNKSRTVEPYFDYVLVASSCKARDVEDAAIRLWDFEKGTCRQILSGGHKSTVATLSFSPDGRFLASSGKDRRLCIWKREVRPPATAAADPPLFTLGWCKESAHKRIVWSVHFCPLDEKLLASGSRDGCVKIWSVIDSGDDDGSLQVKEVFSFAPAFKRREKPDAVTALSFAPLALDSHTAALLALGLESGQIELWKVPLGLQQSMGGIPELLPNAMDLSSCHVGTVTKLAWRPLTARANSNHINNDAAPVKLHLASCSDDCNCRIFEVTL